MPDSIARILPFASARLLQACGYAATVAVLAVLAWVGATIFWRVTTPSVFPPRVAAETDPARAAEAIAARHLFGVAPERRDGGASVTVLPDITLRGVIAPAREGEAAVAVLGIAGKPPLSVRAGDEVVPGVRLHRVLPKSVELERDGQIQSLPLPEKSKSQAVAPVAPATR
jgi:hypothetical protein